MEYYLFFLVIIMIKIIPAVFMRNHCCFIYKILATSLQWLLWKDISVSAIIYYFFILSLCSHFKVTMYVRVFQLTSFKWKRLATFSITYKDVDICHYNDVDFLRETQRSPN